MSYLLSERHFRHNEGYIADIVRNYPMSTVLEVKPPITQADILARNVRYAGRSLMSSQWQPTKVDFPKFIRVWDEIVVSPTVRPGQVICGTEDALRALPDGVVTNILENVPMQSLPYLKIKSNDLDLIKAVIVMHHHGYLTEPSEITSDLDVATLCVGYDIGISHIGTTWTIL